jgi:hypothetical protein
MTALYRGGFSSTRGLGPTMTARGQSNGMLPQTLIMSWLDQLSRLGARISFFHYWYFFFPLLGRHGGKYGTRNIQVLHYEIWPWRTVLNGVCISISNLPENIAWQTHKDGLRPEARGPLKSRAWGGRPTCYPETPGMAVSHILCKEWQTINKSIICHFDTLRLCSF